MPFTIEQFLGVFREYNSAIFPAQFGLVIVALITLVAVQTRNQLANACAYAMLSFLWLWTAIVYHLLFFAKINPAAYVFAAVCAIQAVVFLVWAIRGNAKAVRHRSRSAIFSGSALAIYALVLYPLLSQLLGHLYPASPTFGAPCPTTIFTFAVLVLSRERLPFYIYIVPLAWALIGTSAAFFFGFWQDLGLAAAALLALIHAILDNRPTMPTNWPPP